MFKNRDSEYDERIIQVNRVSRKTKGGNKISFSVLTVVGNRKGEVGIGLGKAPDVTSAIKKSLKLARRSMFKVVLQGTTIPHWVEVKYKAARVLLKPAPPGTGVIAGGPVRALVEAAGIRDIVSKILGSDNKLTNVQATARALKQLKRRRAVEKTAGVKAAAPPKPPKANKQADRQGSLLELNLPAKTLDLLREAGMISIADLAEHQDLTEIKGIGSKKAAKIRELIGKRRQKS